MVESLTNGGVGAGESGKSTILKQMKMIYAEGFTSNDRKQWRVVIFTNLINAFQTILSAMEEQEIPFTDPGNNVSEHSRTQKWSRH